MTLDRPVVPRALERLFLCGAILVYFVGGYGLMNHRPFTHGARQLHTSIDDSIPFLPWTVIIYWSVYAAYAWPLFVVRCPRLFRRTAFAYLAILTVAYLSFRFFPVTAAGLRPDISTLDPHSFCDWGIWLVYMLDAPHNLFPSLHLAIACQAAFSIWRAHRVVGWLAGLQALAIGISTWTVKQHWVADSGAALLLAAIVHMIAMRGYNPMTVPRAERAFSWRGPLLYAGLWAATLACFYVTFRFAWWMPS
jgi:hypothetical protein